MGFRGGVVLLGLLLCSTPACAEGRGDEYRYLQRVQLLSQVNQALWRSIEASGASGLWDPALAAYAHEVTGLGLDRLEGEAPPRELAEFHHELVDLFSQVDGFYAAIAAGDRANARARGERIAADMVRVRESWARVQARYE